MCLDDSKLRVDVDGQNVPGKFPSNQALSHWCIFHRKNAEHVTQTWDQLDSSMKTAKMKLRVFMLLNSRNFIRAAALLNDPNFDHIDLAEKQKVVSECSEAEAWLREKQQQQNALAKYANPILLSIDIKRKAESLDRKKSGRSRKKSCLSSQD